MTEKEEIEKEKRPWQYNWSKYYCPRGFSGVCSSYNPKATVYFYVFGETPSWEEGFYLAESLDFTDVKTMFMGNDKLAKFLARADAAGYIVFEGWGISKDEFYDI